MLENVLVKVAQHRINGLVSVESTATGQFEK